MGWEQCDIIGTITCFLHETLVRSFQLPVKYIWSTRKLFSWIVYSCSTFCFFTKILCWCVGSNVSNISSESNIWVVGLPVRIVHHYYLNSKAKAWEKLWFGGDKQLRSWETPSFIGGCCQVAQSGCRIDMDSAESLSFLQNRYRFCRIAADSAESLLQNRSTSVLRSIMSHCPSEFSLQDHEFNVVPRIP